MANPKTRLGRGLGGLISGAGSSAAKKSATPTSAPKKTAVNAAKKSVVTKPAPVAAPSATGYRELEVKDIVANPYQPRREINPQHVEELAKSIQSEGLLQPIVVRAKGKKFELIAGERRLHAFKHNGSKTIPARIIEASDASSATLALIENLQRENLNPVDEALGYASLVRDFDLTQEAAAERVGKGRATVANAMRLLSLNNEIQGYLSRRLLSTGHAKVLLSLEQDDYRTLLARRIIETGMSVREAEQQVRRLKESSGGTSSNKSKKSEAQETAIRDLEKRIGDHFNTRVSLKHSAKKGKLTIEYYGNDDLDRILEKLGVSS
ncbi:MAG TPA: chromosome partitioning protein ParB [Opitutae bacterium]|nr:chromosome partitioning protein ParB [Opitutae bacterium]